ncbi:MAG TPA: F0F1 ATP synthase subunit alpha [Patescibacteria group bacterium]|nr:F0F1 ATP synthase subunit alpha [Patescibacteria group bacterium]
MAKFTDYLQSTGEIGYVNEAVSSLAYVSGLPGAKVNEVILFESGESGIVDSLEEDYIQVLVFAKKPVKTETKVARTNQIFTIPVGSEYLSQIIDPFGNLLDKFKPFKKPTTYAEINQIPGGINKRKRISKAFDTGVTLVDMLITLGKGQRQLIIGDRKTGKTNFLYQTVMTQAQQGNLCIYVAIGKKRTDIKAIERFFAENKILDKVIVVASTSDDPTSIIYLTPYCAMTMAEYFRDQGQDVVIVLDDLSTHAKFYREIALLARRFPGRNSYPADIFYAHAKLLERAGNFIANKGEYSITCFPVVETVEGDLTGYIPTNLISMTDGHIYFDIEMFSKGRRPAINPFLSVSRVGRQTQSNLKRSINREILSFLSLHDRMEKFSHFGAEATTNIKDILSTGERISTFFDQEPERVYSISMQIFIFGLLWSGFWNNKDYNQLKIDIKKIREMYLSNPTFRQTTDKITEKAESLNDLLTILTQESPRLLQTIGLTSSGNSQTQNSKT